MKNEIKTDAWLWPDHVVGTRESRELRESHNALVNNHAALLAERDRLTQCLTRTLAALPGCATRGEYFVEAILSDIRSALLAKDFKAAQ
jgi:hypothetical protein